MIIRAILAAAALCASAQAARAEQPEHCGLMQATSLDITFDKFGRPIIPVSIDGKNRQMLVDTGGVFSMLTDTASTDLGLPQTPIEGFMAHMFDGELIGYTAKAPNFNVGRIHYDEYHFAVFSHGQLPPEISGTIAPDVIAHFDIELDFANRKFNLFSQKHCPEAVVYWADDYAKLPLKRDWTAQIGTDGQLDGQPVSIVIDTGSAWSVMAPGRARSFGWDGKMESLIKVPVAGSDKPMYFYPFKSLELHGIDIAYPKIQALQPGSRGTGDMILGMNVMRQLRIYIAYGERTMYVTGANAKRATAPDALPLH